MKTYMGFPVNVTQDAITPKMQLSADCPVTPEFRAEMNAWMRDFFGVNVSNVLDDGQIVVGAVPAVSLFGGQFFTNKPLQAKEAIFMNPRTYSQFKAVMHEQASALIPSH